MDHSIRPEGILRFIKTVTALRLYPSDSPQDGMGDPREGARAMKMVAVYLSKAAEFLNLARRVKEAPLKQRFSEMADAYRLLAEERRRDINDKNSDRKVPPQSD